jgi:hypothetical protein
MALCFDRDDRLWSLGWKRDLVTDGDEDSDYPVVRKFSRDGKEIGAYLPRSLWQRRSHPGGAGRGYWTIYAAADRVGLLVHESYANNPAEFLQLDLNGNLLARTIIGTYLSAGRAYSGDGRFYARFRTGAGKKLELRVLDPATGTWTPVPDNLPLDSERALLLGAQGNELVYKTSVGITKLLWARPGAVQ